MTAPHSNPYPAQPPPRPPRPPSALSPADPVSTFHDQARYAGASFGTGVSYPQAAQFHTSGPAYPVYARTPAHNPPLPPPPPPGARPSAFHPSPGQHAHAPSWEESAFISSYVQSSPVGNPVPLAPVASSPSPSAPPHYPAYTAYTPAPTEPQRQASYVHKTTARTSNDSSSNFSLYSLPSESAHSPSSVHSDGSSLRMQQQQAAAQAASEYRSQLESLHLSSASEPAYPARALASASIPSMSNAPALPRQQSAPAKRQPTILMSSPTRMDQPHSGLPDYFRRNGSVDSTWSRPVHSPTPSSQPTFSAAASTSSSHGARSDLTAATTVATSPDVSRRPSYASYATLTPSLHGSTTFASTSFRSNSYDTLPYHESDPRTPALSAAAYLDPALLSHVAVYLADHVPSRTFTGATAISTVARALSKSHVFNVTSSSSSRPLPIPPSPGSHDRSPRPLAHQVAQSLLAQLWIHDAHWGESSAAEGGQPAGSDSSLRDDDSQLFVLSRDGPLGTGDAIPLPTGVLTAATRCYSPFCERLGAEEAEGERSSAEGLKGGCYAYGCPNHRPVPQRRASNLSQAVLSASPASGPATPARAASSPVPPPAPEADNWAMSVPASVLDTLDKREIAYQNQVFELVQGEYKYYEDLCLIETAFVEPLRAATPPIILPPSRLAHFLSSVLLNLSSIREHSRALLAALRARQSESYLFRGIGRIVLDAACEWARDYVDFTVGFPMADFLLKEEKERNPRLAELLMDFSRRPEAARRGFDTFHNRATFRGLRYILLLEQILANADTDDPDRPYLEQALQVIRRQGVEANEGIERTKGRVRLREYHRDLVKKGGDMPDLELLDESRRLLLSGRVYRRPDSSAFTDQFAEAHLILFDNYLVMTKPPRLLDRDPSSSATAGWGGSEAEPHPKYQLARRPVPLDLIQLRTASFSDPPVPRSTGFHLRSNRSAATTGGVSSGSGGLAGAGSASGFSPLPLSSAAGTAIGATPLSPVASASGGTFPTAATAGAGGGSGSPSPGLATNGASGPGAATSSLGDSVLWPISFFQLGRYDGLVFFYVESAALRAQWEAHLQAAVSQRATYAAQHPVVRLDPLADLTFGSTSAVVGSLLSPAAARADPGTRFGKPTCSTPLRAGGTGDWLVVAGCAEGIFVGWRAPASRQRTMQQVVHLEGITQCAVLPEFSFLLVIANKVLVAYALEALIPSKAGSKLDQASRAPQRLSGQKDVSFFKVGKIGDVDPRTLVIYAKKSGVKESVFKALEPVSHAERSRPGGGGGHRFLGLGGGRPEWFRTYKEFFMPSLVTGLHFQRSKLALIGSRGVEIMDLESMRTMTVPDFPPSRHDRALYLLAKRCEDATTLGMFRIGDSKFLLAYSEFAIHVGRHGEPIEGPFIEWESKPEAIAYCAPYIFAISPTIVEIRNAFSGRLAQLITGTHISLTYDGSAIPSSPSPSPGPPPTGYPAPSHSSASSNSPISRRSSLEPLNGGNGGAPGTGGLGFEDLAGPVERRLHLTMKQGAYHVLFEVVIVA